MSSDSSRLEVIDALRGVAALAVLVYHARADLWIGTRESWSLFGFSLDPQVWLGYASFPFNYGGLGVTLFFVLSGYCIHRKGAWLLSRSNSQLMNWTDFAKRRILRIYPTYVAALAISALADFSIAKLQGLPLDQSFTWRALAASLLTVQGYVAPQFTSNAVFWTLAIEMHLYAAYPLLFYFSKHFRPENVLVFVFLISLLYTSIEFLTNFESLFVYRGPRGPILLPYWFTWTLGFYIAEIEAGRAKRIANKTLLGVAVASGLLGIALLNARVYLFAEMFCGLFFFAVVHTCIFRTEKNLRMTFVMRCLAGVGVFSYSLYAIHGPILNVFKYLLQSDNPGFKFRTVLPVFAVCGIVIAVAYIFFLMVERWSIAAGSRTGKAVRG